MKKKLAIIGGNYLQYPLVQKAQEMGLEVHCFAWEDGAVCKEIADYFYPISITEKDKILQKCQEIGIDGVTSIASDLAVVTMNYVATRMGLIGNQEKYAAIQTNKYLMRNAFDEAGCPSPRYAVVKSSDEALKLDWLKFACDGGPADDWIVKPTDRSGSRCVVRVHNEHELAEAVDDAIEVSFAKEAIIEEFVVGAEVSVETISWKGKHYTLTITDKVTTEKHFVEIGHHQPSHLASSTQEKIIHVVHKALTAMHIEYGASHAELKITERGDLYIMEIGARMGGAFIGSHLVPLSTGYDFMAAVINQSLGFFDETIIPPTHIPLSLAEKTLHSGVLFLVQETDYLVDVIAHSSMYPEIKVAGRNEDDIRPAISNSDRTGYVIYQSDHRISSYIK